MNTWLSSFTNSTTTNRVGANKDAKDKYGKTAYDVACDGYSGNDKEQIKTGREQCKAELQKMLRWWFCIFLSF